MKAKYFKRLRSRIRHFDLYLSRDHNGKSIPFGDFAVGSIFGYDEIDAMKRRFRHNPHMLARVSSCAECLGMDQSDFITIEGSAMSKMRFWQAFLD